MKTLFITPYLSIDSCTEFSVNKTGFGYMVSDIASCLSEEIDVEIFASDSKGSSYKYNGFTILRRTYKDIIFNILHCTSIWPIISLIFKYKTNIAVSVRLLYYWASTGYLKKIIKEGGYDIVHIHDLSFSVIPWTMVCKELKKPNLITLHALKSFSATVRLDQSGKRFERDFFKLLGNSNYCISVLSTGMKSKIESSANRKGLTNIKVIPNAFFLKSSEDIDCTNLRKKYGLRDDSKIVLCVGNICRRKNQGQLIKAFELLPEMLAENTYILFLGGFLEHDYTENELTQGCFRKDHYIFCGVIDKNFVGLYYMQADVVALVSQSEAFGLSLIEGMHYGLPGLMFTDMEAFDEIYSERSSVGVCSHADIDVSKGLQDVLTRSWDRREIAQLSAKFNSDKMRERYINLYAQLIVGNYEEDIL